MVLRAIAKWPNVPHCHGWLGLDARGRWYLRDQATQQRGAFASGAPGARGELLQQQRLVEFIGRNYEADAEGQWYFQNGPERVYVELEATPWVWRLHDDGRVLSHTGCAVQPEAALVDENGRLYLACPRGLGVVHSQDMALAADLIEQGRWQPVSVPADSLPRRFGYVPSPQQALG